jgi:hypothetical protein
MKKDVIYVDVEDDITAIIDKTLATTQPIAALVLPKRPSVLMSSVNMKLLKKSAQQAKKRFVIITNDQTVRTIAGGAGIYVAKTLQSKPEVPVVERSRPLESEDADIATTGATAALGAAVAASNTVPVAAAVPAAKASRFPSFKSAKTPAVAEVAAGDADTDTVELDNTAPEVTDTDAKDKKIKKNPKLKIPSFEKFRLWFFAAIVIVIALLITGIVVAFRSDKANVVIKTKTKDELLSMEFTAASETKTVDVEQKKIPVSIKETKKTYSEKAPATGQVDKGEKATGTVTLTNCSKEDKLDDTTRTVPSGATVSIDGLSYVTTASVTLEPSGYTGNTCKFDKSKDVDVIAKEAGEKFNIAAKDGYTVSGLATASGSGTAMSGGTTKIAKVLTEDDIANLRAKITGSNTDDQKAALEKLLKDEGSIAIADTFSATQGEVVLSAKAGDEVADVTATMGDTFTMAGVQESALEELIKAEGIKKLDKEKEEVYDSGIKKARLKVSKPGKPGEYLLAVSSTVVSGPKIDQDKIKRDMAGKKRSQAETEIGEWPGVQSVTVEYSPFWVSKAPSKPERITITIESADGSK